MEFFSSTDISALPWAYLIQPPGMGRGHLCFEELIPLCSQN